MTLGTFQHGEVEEEKEQRKLGRNSAAEEKAVEWRLWSPGDKVLHRYQNVENHQQSNMHIKMTI